MTTKTKGAPRRTAGRRPLEHKAGGAAAPREEAVLGKEETVIATGTQADCDAFMEDARAIDARDVLAMRANLQLALQNAKEGSAAVLAEKERLAKLPETNPEHLATIGRLALAVIFADTQIERSTSPTELAPLFEKATGSRKLLLKVAIGLAEAGKLKQRDVDDIIKGSGKLDTARDCMALAALFTKNAAAIKGLHPVTKKDIDDAAEVGAKLLGLLKTRRSKRKPAKTSEATDTRDRLWTLLTRRWDELWRAGAYLFGRDGVDAKVPALQASRSAPKKKTKKGGGPAAPAGGGAP
jgi:hypothetical protein